MERRYYSFSRYLREKFGRPVYKIPLEAGFNCPNRDGTVGYGGCTFCANESFSPYAGGGLPIARQIAEVKQRVRQRHPDAKFFAYFQAYTNTYADPETLRKLYDPILDDPDIVGLALGTRPDCVPDATLDLIAGYQSALEVWMEYGLQSTHDATLKRINRGHSAEQFFDAVGRSKERGLKVCAHLILGLPGETIDHAATTARALNEYRVNGVKFHHLQVLKGTALAEEYRAGGLSTLSLKEYVDWVCTLIEVLDPRIVIQRLVGDTLDSRALIAPIWNRSKSEILLMIDKELERRQTYQGRNIEVALDEVE
ncbi:MAG: TIGR01212 family radical SAM protein [Eubacteriales bacterium]|jgi:radical SAM protein (TIGR01212 family)|nr:TIGR01212 family radical SAM protein [Bacillota bacterium]MBV1728405.1 TIGR01212 family radical SAM protein [Desulforudis sp.]MDQ7789374.1 TIGR01212 family radical SAM protein [Clostridia bacterium]MDZ4042426.1 TIGR01212 family radical SAM protein [Eubacteriales bacterium]MBV1735341.1 TIGR01212 family radical SAM protein [Desulforudis sp.]